MNDFLHWLLFVIGVLIFFAFKDLLFATTQYWLPISILVAIFFYLAVRTKAEKREKLKKLADWKEMKKTQKVLDREYREEKKWKKMKKNTARKKRKKRRK
jgi:nitrate/nitrite transporter NarK